MDRENRARIGCGRTNLSFSGPLRSSKYANVPAIFEFSAENAKIADWLAERGGFEPPVPREIVAAEFAPILAHYSLRKKTSVLERICSP